MTFGSYDPNVHNRFDSTNFLGNGYNWSGVGKSGSAWATMISPTLFVSANHFHPAIGGTVTFWLSNSSSSAATVNRTVAGGQSLGSTDLWLGSLDASVPTAVAIYELGPAIADMAHGLGTYENQLTFTVGTRGPLGFAVGQNRFDATETSPNVPGLPTPFDAIGFFQDPIGTPNSTGNNETLVQPGDSGAPSFIDDGGTLKLAGIHSFNAGNVGATDFNPDANFSDHFNYRSSATDALLANGAVRSISFDTFIPTYATQIANVTAVPEPSASLYFLGIAALVGVRPLVIRITSTERVVGLSLTAIARAFSIDEVTRPR